jgi:hypothetical protein
MSNDQDPHLAADIEMIKEIMRDNDEVLRRLADTSVATASQPSDSELMEEVIRRNHSGLKRLADTD